MMTIGEEKINDINIEIEGVMIAKIRKGNTKTKINQRIIFYSFVNIKLHIMYQ